MTTKEGEKLPRGFSFIPSRNGFPRHLVYDPEKLIGGGARGQMVLPNIEYLSTEEHEHIIYALKADVLAELEKVTIAILEICNEAGPIQGVMEKETIALALLDNLKARLT